jgi:hypothetical protein
MFEKLDGSPPTAALRRRGKRERLTGARTSNMNIATPGRDATKHFSGLLLRSEFRFRTNMARECALS